MSNLISRPLILSFGEVLWDLFPEGERFGGAPANFACHAANLGADVAMVSAIGDDQRGRKALDIFNGYGVDISLIQIIRDAPTGTVGVALDTEGKPTFTIHEDTAWDRIAWTNEQSLRVKNADAVYFGTLGQRSDVSRSTIRRCIDDARDAGVPRIVDINLRKPFYDAASIRDSIDLASILKLSDDELPEVCSACGIESEDSLDAILRRILSHQGLDLAVMTCGAKGAVLATPNEVISQSGIETEIKDTVGAGDAFSASFLLGVLHGEPHTNNLRKACATAAKVCAQSGAVPPPSRRNN